MIWAPQLAVHFVDLTEAGKDIAAMNFPSIIQSQTVGGKLVALPIFTDAPALYYRKDLMEKYGIKDLPKTWDEMLVAAELLMAGELGDAGQAGRSQRQHEPPPPRGSFS